MWLGQVKLDLSLATLPPEGALDVFVPVGEIVIYVPREVQVTVNALAVLGEIKALGEERTGVLARLQEEFLPERTPAGAGTQLELRLRTFIGSVKVIRVSGPGPGLKDMMKHVAGQALLAVLDAFKQQRRDEKSPT
jgi:predicted membrane protein